MYMCNKVRFAKSHVNIQDIYNQFNQANRQCGTNVGSIEANIEATLTKRRCGDVFCHILKIYMTTT